MALDFLNEWPYWYPRALVAFSVVLAVAMGIALSTLCGWHYYLITTSQTTVEFYNNQYEKGVLKAQGEVFVNMYSFGVKENLKRFFNIGDHNRWWTVLLPIPIAPQGNGKTFEKCHEFYELPRTQQQQQVRHQHEFHDLEDIKDV